MSTRYIWQYKISTLTGYTTTASNATDWLSVISHSEGPSNAGLYYGPSITKSVNGNTYNLSSITNHYGTIGIITIPAGNYFYFGGGWPIYMPESSSSYDSGWQYNYNGEFSSTVLFYAKTDCNIYSSRDYASLSSGTMHIVLGVYSTSSAYATDSYSGAYEDYDTYTYVGEDCIDPTAIAITNSVVIAGSAATIQVTKRSNYYNTTYYEYQYSINGGTSWTTLTSSTSATSYNFTVPSGATSIKVRTIVHDNAGFYSNDYITSPKYSVNSYTTYTSVSGVIKGVNPVVAYGGGVRTAKAVVCKNGVIKTL